VKCFASVRLAFDLILCGLAPCESRVRQPAFRLTVSRAALFGKHFGVAKNEGKKMAGKKMTAVGSCHAGTEGHQENEVAGVKRWGRRLAFDLVLSAWRLGVRLPTARSTSLLPNASSFQGVDWQGPCTSTKPVRSVPHAAGRSGRRFRNSFLAVSSGDFFVSA